MTALIRLLCVSLAAIMVSVLVVPDAEARRMGGGRSIGKSFGSVPPRPAQPQPPRRADSASPAGQAAAAPAAAGARRGGLMGPIAGLAAGLGIAALASALGFGEGLANLITLLLLVVGGIFLVRFILSRLGRASGPQPATASAGAGMHRDGPPVAGGGSWPAAGGAAAAAEAPARAPQAVPATPDQASDDDAIPAGFDVEGFVRQAKVQFVRLQAVYDAADLDDLREFTTPQMYAELEREIAERGARPNRTDVVTLEADLLGVRSEPDEYLAAIHFSGMVREADDAPAEPFDEVWTLVKPTSGPGGWVLAGIHQTE